MCGPNWKGYLIIIVIASFRRPMSKKHGWMDGLRKEPLNISVDLGEGSLALALVCLSAPLAWIVTLSYLTSTLLIQHRVTGALWHINNWNNFNVFKEEMSSHTHTPAFTLIFTDLNASGISQQLTQGYLSSETTPDTYSEGACEQDNRGEQAFLQAYPSAGSHAEGGVSANRGGNFRRTKGHLNDITLRGSLFLRNQTHPQRWEGKLTVIETCVEEGTFVSIYTTLARDLIHTAPVFLRITPSLCWPQAPDIQSALLTKSNGFQILQGGLCVCQTWKWKANTSPPPSVLTYL